ncbi:P-II family nitrogen regulator [uncultured Bacteroides sp.]|uniref:P-II family nitrogen regulator n=1 Tax=uncultured Bacteroides sp. TaxID=162156 RepID=UPI002AABFD0D|nr:P-II family nitrogen regulator [uncultured Bacteroides sp.]
MKKIEAIIRTSKFEEVKDALNKIGIEFFSFWEATGVGNEKNLQRTYRGEHGSTALIPRRLLTIVVRDENVRKTVDCLLDVAYTGQIGDGKIFVSPIEESWRIRTRESGDESLYSK